MEGDKEDTRGTRRHPCQAHAQLSRGAGLVVLVGIRRILLHDGLGCRSKSYRSSRVLRGLTVLQVWHTSLPVWALLLSILLPALYVLPSGFIFAMTGQGVSLFFFGDRFSADALYLRLR